MKHIILFLFVLLALISCVKEEEDSPLLSAPVITLKEESPIYKTKIGREITIAPVYENTDSETTFNWTIDGKSICTTSTLTFSADEAGRYFILISATNAGGTTEKEIRIDVFQLDGPTISIADADKGFKVLQGSELTITPIVDSFLETSYSWQIKFRTCSYFFSIFIITDSNQFHPIIFACGCGQTVTVGHTVG